MDRPSYTVVEPGKDRLVRARRARRCTLMGCGVVVQPGEYYLDVAPPEREPGYFAQCLPCAVSNGLLLEAAT